MKFLIIIPAHNEASNMAFCLESLKNQSFQDFVCVVVNDGSTDKTKSIVENYVHENHLQFKIFNLELSHHEPGAKVVRTFNKGLESIDWQHFDVICKYDADIIFPKDYLERIHQIFIDSPNVGIASGLVYIRNQKNVAETGDISKDWFDFKNQNNDWIYENLSSKNHVRGPIKAYRKECFEAMKGLRPVLGWDNLDVLLAKKNKWEVITIKELWVKHLRPTAYKYKSQKAEKLGQYFYNIGLSLPLAIISSLKSSFKNHSAKEFFITINSFLKQNEKRQLTEDEIQFIRKQRWRDFLKNFGL